ncbi:hypothetical protein NFI96_012753 [Prochilodus magdalenae]|nr:hypothetical protein NFI96_012753 [Prochilodus magdalenae]
MKAIVQRVSKASVVVGEEQISSIGRGLCVLLGISAEDTQKDADYMVRKILNLRVFEDENGRAWSRSVMDKELEVLCVSQFTLQCILKGNKPDFHLAMPAELSQPFYNNILEQMKSAYKPELIKDGQFGAYMQVNIQNDGPVTIHLESPAGPTDAKQLSKLEKQQQRKEKTRPKGESVFGTDLSTLQIRAAIFRDSKQCSTTRPDSYNDMVIILPPPFTLLTNCTAFISSQAGILAKHPEPEEGDNATSARKYFDHRVCAVLEQHVNVNVKFIVILTACDFNVKDINME